MTWIRNDIVLLPKQTVARFDSNPLSRRYKTNKTLRSFFSFSFFSLYFTVYLFTFYTSPEVTLSRGPRMYRYHKYIFVYLRVVIDFTTSSASIRYTYYNEVRFKFCEMNFTSNQYCTEYDSIGF